MFNQEQLRQRLLPHLQALNLADGCDSLLAYVKMLHRWNQAYNLTAVRDPDVMLSRHVFDSLAILPWLKGERVLDVGSGGGLPGIPIAITQPQKHVVLIDSNGKKTRFLQEVKRELSLTNVTVVQDRVERYHSATLFDSIVSRAFSNLLDMTSWTKHLLNADGIWLAMKAGVPEDELGCIPYPFHIHPYSFPGMDAKRCCIIISNS